MKIKKPEDEKYFKDVVLNDILEEISNETGAPLIHKSKKRKSHKNKFFSKTLFFIIIAVLFFLFVMVLFSLVTDATTEVKPITKVPKTVLPDTPEWKMNEDIGIARQNTVKKVVKEKPVVHKKVQNETIEIKAVKAKPVPRQKTERELAKEALRQQMLN